MWLLGKWSSGVKLAGFVRGFSTGGNSGRERECVYVEYVLES